MGTGADGDDGPGVLYRVDRAIKRGLENVIIPNLCMVASIVKGRSCWRDDVW